MTENMHTSVRYEAACRRAALSLSRYLLMASTYTIVYVISLLAIGSAHAGPSQSERQTIVTLSQEGRSSFAAGLPEKALEAYQKALVQAESGED